MRKIALLYIVVVITSISMVSCSAPLNDIDYTMPSPDSNINVNTFSPIPSKTIMPVSTTEDAIPAINNSIHYANCDKQYFVAGNENIFFLQNSDLISASSEGENKRVIDEGCQWFYIAQDNEWVYYMKERTLYKVSLDGKTIEKVKKINGDICNLLIYEDCVIYSIDEPFNKTYIYDIKKDKAEELLQDNPYSDFLVYNNKLYYMLDKMNDNNHESIQSVYELDLKTKNNRLLFEEATLTTDYTIIGNRIYYINGKDHNYINVFDLNNNEKTQISKRIANILGSFHQFLSYQTAGDKNSDNENAYYTGYMEIRAYDTQTGKDYLIGETDQLIIEMCCNEKSIYILTTGIINIRPMIDIYYIHRIDLDSGKASFIKIMEIEYYSNPDD